MHEKILTVATEVQKACLDRVLLKEMREGFWHKMRSNKTLTWDDVTVVVGTNLGPSGFEISKNYNFVNLAFYSTASQRLLDVAREIDPCMTPKLLKKQLISLNQIIGGRLKVPGGSVKKIKHRNQQNSEDQNLTSITVRKVAATFANNSI